MFQVLYFVVVLIDLSLSFWQPGYKVSLHDELSFEIGTNPEHYHDSEEEELIKERDIHHMELEKDQELYHGLHRVAKRANDRYDRMQRKFEKEVENDDVQYDNGLNIDRLYAGKPWMAKLVHTQEEINMHKRDTNETTGNKTISDDDEDYAYDYEGFKAEYYDYVKVHSNETFNLTKAGRVNDTLLPPLPNISAAVELEHEGVAAVRCSFGPCNETALGYFRSKPHRWAIPLAFFILYLLIAGYCWCSKGWCCCCCRCACCFPYRNIEKAKRYMMRNPPGHYDLDGFEPEAYVPSLEELEAHRKLENALRRT